MYGVGPWCIELYEILNLLKQYHLLKSNVIKIRKYFLDIDNYQITCKKGIKRFRFDVSFQLVYFTYVRKSIRCGIL